MTYEVVRVRMLTANPNDFVWVNWAKVRCRQMFGNITQPGSVKVYPTTDVTIYYGRDGGGMYVEVSSNAQSYRHVEMLMPRRASFITIHYLREYRSFDGSDDPDKFYWIVVTSEGVLLAEQKESVGVYFYEPITTETHYPYNTSFPTTAGWFGGDKLYFIKTDQSVWPYTSVTTSLTFTVPDNAVWKQLNEGDKHVAWGQRVAGVDEASWNVLWAEGKAQFDARVDAFLVAESAAIIADFKTGALNHNAYIHKLKELAPYSSHTSRPPLTENITWTTLKDEETWIDLPYPWDEITPFGTHIEREYRQDVTLSYYTQADPPVLVTQTLVGYITELITESNGPGSPYTNTLVRTRTYNNVYASNVTTDDTSQIDRVGMERRFPLYADSGYYGYTPGSSTLGATSFYAPGAFAHIMNGTDVDTPNDWKGGGHGPEYFHDMAFGYTFGGQADRQAVPAIPKISIGVTYTVPEIINSYRADIPIVYNPAVGRTELWNDSKAAGFTGVKVILYGHSETLRIDTINGYRPYVAVIGAANYSFSYETGVFTFLNFTKPKDEFGVEQDSVLVPTHGHYVVNNALVKYIGLKYPDVVESAKVAEATYKPPSGADTRTALQKFIYALSRSV